MNNFKHDQEAVAGVLIGVLVGILALVGVIFWVTGLNNVDAGERTVIFHSNGDLTTLTPGMFKWQNPVTTDAYTYNVQKQLHTDTAEGITKDLQVVTVEVGVYYHPQESEISWIHQNLGQDYAARVIPRSVQDAVKAAVSYYNAEDMTAGTRELVKQAIKDRVAKDLEAVRLILDDLSVTDFDFSNQFNAATEAKVVAQQRALEAKNKLEQARYEANQTIIMAQAQAESARIISEQIEQNPAYVEYLYAQAFAANWNGQLPIYSGGAEGSGPIPFVNVGATSKP